jgi:hypothetical protein
MRAIAISALWLSARAVAIANDGYWVEVGDARGFQNSEQIALLSEDLRIILHDSFMNVRVKYVFKNEGNAITATLAFPETCSNGAVRMEYDEFRSFVDGRRASVVREVLLDPDVDDSYEAIWKKQVHFRRGQRRVVEVHYRMPMGADNTFGSGGTYILRTGATWKGPISHLWVTVDWTNCRVMSRPSLTSLPFKEEHPGVATCYLRNIEPEEDIVLHRVDGFFNFWINGTEVPTHQVSTVPAVVFEKGSILFPESTSTPYLSNWLGELFGRATTSDGPSVDEWASPALRRFGNAIKIHNDGTIEDGHGKRYRMRRAPVVRAAHVIYETIPVRYIYLRDFVEALGGTCTWNARLRRVEVTLR